MKYMLIINSGAKAKVNFDDFKENLLKELTIVCSSDRVTYMNGKGYVICHFECDLFFEEMSTYIEMVFDDTPGLGGLIYFLTPFSGDISSNCPKEQIDFLLDVNDKKPIKIPDFKPFGGDIILHTIMNEMFNFQTIPTCELGMDEILDKISEKGIKSLTTLELEKLNEYSSKLK